MSPTEVSHSFTIQSYITPQAKHRVHTHTLTLAIPIKDCFFLRDFRSISGHLDHLRLRFN